MPKRRRRKCSPEPNDLTATICPRLPGPNGENHDEVEDALEVFNIIYRRALKQPDVVGVDIGYMITESDQSFEDYVGIRFHVETKLSSGQLERLGRVDLKCVDQVRELFRGLDVEKDPKLKRITINDIPTDVVEAQYAPFHLHQNKVRSRMPKTSIEMLDDEMQSTSLGRVEPVVGGVSVGRYGGPAGTLGMVVHDRTDGKPCILGNWHVLAGFENSQVDTPIYQPAVFDGGTRRDQVADLKRWVFNSTADAALAQLNGYRDYTAGSILGLWFPMTDTLEPWLGLPVKKWGRSTGFTQGFVDGIHMATDIPYGQATPRHFENQLHIAPRYQGRTFSDLGDSGSVIVADFPVRFRQLPPRCEEEGSGHRRVRIKPELDGPPVRYLNDIRKSEARLQDWNDNRTKVRAYFAVGMLFAGDTAASRFGEFALAHPMVDLSEELGFSIQPVFVPETDMIPQVPARYRRLSMQESTGQGGSPPQPVSVVAGPRSALGGPQPDVPPEPDPGP